MAPVLDLGLVEAVHEQLGLLILLILVAREGLSSIWSILGDKTEYFARLCWNLGRRFGNRVQHKEFGKGRNLSSRLNSLTALIKSIDLRGSTVRLNAIFPEGSVRIEIESSEEDGTNCAR